MTAEGAELARDPPDPLLGTLLSERYQVLRVLGAGGMGRVYEAEHVLIRRRVALKCLHAQYAARPDVVARFRREALAATAVHNRHIVEVTDMGRLPDGGIFLVLELLDGRDLARELAERGALSFTRAVHVAAQLCDGLGAAHAAGIVHRDLKPENVFLVRRDGDDDFVKIVDFGISKIKHSEDTATDTGVILGTPMYMAPEQLQGHKNLDHRVDLYAVGVILFRALTGQSPFVAPTPLGLVYQVCTTPAPSVLAHRPATPPELAALVARLLEKEPDRRFPDAASVAKALRALRVEDGDVPPRVEVAPGTSGVQRALVPLESAPTLEALATPTPDAATAVPDAAPPTPVVARVEPAAAPLPAARAASSPFARVAVAALVTAALALAAWRALMPGTPPVVAAARTGAVAAPPVAPPPPPQSTAPAPPPPATPEAPAAHVPAETPVAPIVRNAARVPSVPPPHAPHRAPPPTRVVTAPTAQPAPPPPVAAPPSPVMAPRDEAPAEPPRPARDGVYRGPRNGLPETL